MDLRELPPAIQKIRVLGDPGVNKAWTDYQSIGIGPEHIETLIDIIRSTSEFWEETAGDENDPDIWLPVHAWRALGQMKSKEALPALLDLLRLIEEQDSDLVQEDLPGVFNAIGAAAIPPLTTYLLDQQHEMWARIAAADGLHKIAVNRAKSRAVITDTLIRALEDYPDQDPTFNGFMVSFLMDLKAVEAAPLVEQAFRAGQVDEAIIGDWEDYQIGIGLLDRRLTAPRQRFMTAFTDGLPVKREAVSPASQRLKKGKKKRKKNQKRKKK